MAGWLILCPSMVYEVEAVMSTDLDNDSLRVKAYKEDKSEEAC